MDKEIKKGCMRANTILPVSIKYYSSIGCDLTFADLELI